VEIVIFGAAGKLGPGLVGTRARQAGLNVHGVVRSPREDTRSADVVRALAREREIHVRVRDAADIVVPLHDIYYSDDPADRTRLERFLAETPDVLVCSAARAGQDDLAALLTRVLRRRHVTGMLAVCPCENDVSPSMAALGAVLGRRRGTAFLPAMVDRICTEIDTLDRHVVVTCEADSDWVVTVMSGAAKLGTRISPGMRSLLSALAALEISVVNPDQCDRSKLRKRLLMNGVQTSLAYLALDADHDDLGAYLQTAVGTEALVGLMHEYSIHLLHDDPKLSPKLLHGHQIWYADRIVAAADSVARVLNRNASGYLAPALAVTSARIAETYDVLLKVYGDEKDARESFVAKALDAAQRINRPF
jgi:hypothetical protein